MTATPQQKSSPSNHRHLNVEIKARCPDPSFIRNWLNAHQAEFKGEDHQVDTYFHVHSGRLKLREGKIENSLIYYERDNQAGPKCSDFHLTALRDTSGIKAVLTAALGIKTVVDKLREIYYISNVKFHIDTVSQLGSFVEIEAGNLLAGLSKEDLRSQCDYYLKEFGIGEEELVAGSYSDMIMEIGC